MHKIFSNMWTPRCVNGGTLRRPTLRKSAIFFTQNLPRSLRQLTHLYIIFRTTTLALSIQNSFCLKSFKVIPLPLWATFSWHHRMIASNMLLYFGETKGWSSLLESLDFPNLLPTRNKLLLSKKRSRLYSLLDLLTSTLLSEFELRTLISSPNCFNWTILTVLFASSSKSSTFVRFPRLSDVGFLICFLQIYFAGMTHAIVFFIFNHLVVSKLIFQMMVPSVTVKLTLISFFSSRSFLLTGLILPLFSQSPSFDQRNDGSENHLWIFSKFLISIILWTIICKIILEDT